MNLHDVIIKPIVTEKSQILSSDFNQYSFEVARQATKTEIQQAVEKLFSVNVVKVATYNMRGKVKRRGPYMRGRTPDWKRAVVTLKEGDAIPVLQELM
jgi:large subunit ribosomal protein L23